MSDERVFAPGDWDLARGRRLVAGAAIVPFVVNALPQLLLLSRGVGWASRLAVLAATILLTVPVLLLVVRLGVLPRRLVVYPDAIELRRRDRVLTRLSRHDARLTVFRARLGMVQHGAGPPQLVITDGTTAIRLGNARWIEHHEAIIDAIGLPDELLDESEAVQQHPEAFGALVRRPGLVVAALLTSVTVVVLGGGVLISVLTG